MPRPKWAVFFSPSCPHPQRKTRQLSRRRSALYPKFRSEETIGTVLRAPLTGGRVPPLFMWPSVRPILPPFSCHQSQLDTSEFTTATAIRNCWIIARKFGSMNGKYKQENKPFFQQMPPANQQAVLLQLKSDYRHILINYFASDIPIKKKIDSFINTAFSTNIPVPHIIEIHMELIEEFSKQLKLEGRSDEVLLDYRLTLIDILAHLCEMYRCSMPKQF